MFPTIPLFYGMFLPTYFLVMSVTVCIALTWVSVRASNKDLSRNVALDLSLLMMVTSLLGARLFHVFYENFDYYQADPLKIIYLWEGGFVYYGGALLAAFSAALFLYIKARREMETYFDLFAPVMSLSYILGRFGCFLTGCCFGKTCDLPWAVAGRHPTQLYALFFELGAFILILGIDKTPFKERPKFLAKPGAVFYVWLFLHAIGRLIMEHYRDDFRGPSLGLSISSWISLVLAILAAALLVRKSAKS